MLEISDVNTGKAVDILEGHQHEVTFVSFVALGPRGMRVGGQSLPGSPIGDKTMLPDINSRSNRRQDPNAMKLSASMGSLSGTAGSNSGRFVKPQRKDAREKPARVQTNFP